jgi:hypothetical protein
MRNAGIAARCKCGTYLIAGELNLRFPCGVKQLYLSACCGHRRKAK